MRRTITAAALCFLVSLTLAPFAYPASAFSGGGVSEGSGFSLPVNNDHYLVGISSNVFIGKVVREVGHVMLKQSDPVNRDIMWPTFRYSE